MKKNKFAFVVGLASSLILASGHIIAEDPPVAPKARCVAAVQCRFPKEFQWFMSFGKAGIEDVTKLTEADLKKFITDKDLLQQFIEDNEDRLLEQMFSELRDSLKEQLKISKNQELSDSEMENLASNVLKTTPQKLKTVLKDQVQLFLRELYPHAIQSFIDFNNSKN